MSFPSRRSQRVQTEPDLPEATAHADGHVHAHGHSHSLTLSRADRRRASAILAAFVVPLLIATLIALAVLWPRGETPMGSIPLGATGMTFEQATVVGMSDEVGSEIRAVLDTGQGAGQEIPVQAPPEVLTNGVSVGDRMTVLFDVAAMGSGSPYVFVDFVRDVPLMALAVLYAVVVALVARWRGLAAIVGLCASLAVIAVFVLPALMLGTSPLVVALVGSSAMMFVSVYLAHGISIRTTTALLGTFIGLAATVLLAAWGTAAANLTGAGSDETYMLTGQFPNLRLSDLLLCGIVISALGALNDVTITQASAVWELHASDPTVSTARLFSRAMRIGRDHIASTVYTLAFAYVGTALPLLMIVTLYERTLMQMLTTSVIAEEVVRTLVSSIGLVLAIPITTGIAALLVRAASGGPAATGHDPGGESADRGSLRPPAPEATTP